MNKGKKGEDYIESGFTSSEFPLYVKETALELQEANVQDNGELRLEDEKDSVSSLKDFMQRN